MAEERQETGKKKGNEKGEILRNLPGRLESREQRKFMWKIMCIHI